MADMNCRMVLLCALALALSACAGGGGDREPFAYGIESYFAPDQPHVIEVHVRDPLPVAQAELIDDAGQRQQAKELSRERVMHYAEPAPWPGWGFGVMGGSSGHVATGFGLGIPFFGGPGDQAVAVNESIARFEIPDLSRYAGAWQRWRIHLVLDDGRASRTVEMVPPAPVDQAF
jgi:hypothetical protein